MKPEDWARTDPAVRAAILRSLSHQHPNLDAAIAEIARLSGKLTLPKGTVHVISDVHGDDVKLRHVINNASGTLRPLVTRLFGERMSDDELERFLALIFYPAQALDYLSGSECLAAADSRTRHELSRITLSRQIQLVRVLARRCGVERLRRVLPAEYADLLAEVILDPQEECGDALLEAVVCSLVEQGNDFRLIRRMARVARNLAIDELIIAGDLWDRGPRGDRVVDSLTRQPNVAFTWGNHDVAWLGACLGQGALIAHVLRVSLRYGRLAQLEEGYGIPLSPLERLVRDVYAGDPADCFKTRGGGLRDDLLMARMQKAAAILQFKLEGQTIDRNPTFRMDSRKLLHRIDREAGTVRIDGRTWPLQDKYLPTVDHSAPYELSAEERRCMDRIVESFQTSQKLWEQMSFLVARGTMCLVRDQALIFHGCLPIDERGEFLPMPIDDQMLSGRELFETLDEVIARALRSQRQPDLDVLWYLWSGPRSPLFGKDRITTFERYFVAGPASHREVKNPYFELIHDTDFCDKVLAEFGVDPQEGLIVNGHVPVKIEQGESPMKRSGKAITIDGAFSEAYGDRGYTLVLEPEHTYLAEHHHFESVEAAVRDGVDIIPKRTPVRRWPEPRRVGQTERGEQIRAEIGLLEQLVKAYRRGALAGD